MDSENGFRIKVLNVNPYPYLELPDIYSAKFRAVEIMRETACMALTTLHVEEEEIIPWSRCVEFTFDPEGIYWVSAQESTHSRDIIQNSKVSIVIADLNAPREKRQGVFMNAKAYEINDLKEIQKVYQLFYRRIGDMKPVEEWIKLRMDDCPRRVYKAVPYKLGINYSEHHDLGFSRDCIDKTLDIPFKDFKRNMRVL